VVAHVHPASVGGVGEGGDDERLTPLEVGIADEPDVLGAFSARIGVRLLAA
jgi:hypothetical protein